MPLDVVKIPQNVYVEDRIIGPITLKQLIITGIGVGISYAIYALATRAGVRSLPVLVVAWVPAVIASAFAFLKVNDLPLFSIILLAIEHSKKPSMRVWSPHAGIAINIITRATMETTEHNRNKFKEDTIKLAHVSEQLKKRQQELTEFTNHSMDTVTAVAAKPVEEEIDVPVAVAAEANSSVPAGPVRKEKMRVSALEPRWSIDSIQSHLVIVDHHNS